ncbi:unnamed protein product [Enterobius vermicularis]|uniref:PH domain-containing protein n=1 Tax=Enterobius vermicularis TaxID=51028 RepID=A0A158QBA2_ENTVE|nr:unnamed protein product [Enterobius vermicularis]
MIMGRIIAGLLEEGDDSAQNKRLTSCRIAMEKIATFNMETKSTRVGLINFVKLLEIESEVDGVENITQSNRVIIPINFSAADKSDKTTPLQFVREGFLCRWSNNKLVPHILIAFNDVLLYGSLPGKESNFLINGIIPLRDAQVEEGEISDLMTDSKTAFVICTSKTTAIFSANSNYIKELWKDDIRKTIKAVNETKMEQLPQQISVKFFVSKESDKISTLRLCWHRRTTITADALIKAATNQMSGYLFRKYRTSTGWQRLWVVLAAFTLFFYKEYSDDIPSANLNLIDYNLSLPWVSDRVTMDNVFKLSYLKHSYFFKTKDSYQFSRWTEAIRIATQNGSSTDIFPNLIPRSIS